MQHLLGRDAEYHSRIFVHLFTISLSEDMKEAKVFELHLMNWRLGPGKDYTYNNHL